MVDFFKAQAIEVLTTLGFNYTEQDSDSLQVLKVLPSANVNLYRKIVIDKKKSMVLVYSFDKLMKLNTPEEKTLGVEFVCEANQFVDVGSLEIREEKGMLHYRISQLLPGVEDIREVLKFMLEQSDRVFQNARATFQRLRQLVGPENRTEEIQAEIQRFAQAIK
mmetsp:Transcript_19991/g.37104  ORF Transcript_19991/g.37104 Transcript_19991/m.37104 type:complete len:164 (-) Transcript_19991:1513-2004(-)